MVDETEFDIMDAEDEEDAKEQLSEAFYGVGHQDDEEEFTLWEDD